MKTERAALIAAIALAASSCATRVFTRPTGTGTPAPEAAAAWSTATAECRNVQNDFPTMQASARVDGRGMPGLGVIGGITLPGQINLTANYGGNRVFELRGTTEQALLLYGLGDDQNGYVLARTDEILDALMGLRLTATDLLRIVTGCVTSATTIENAQRFGKLVAIRTTEGTVYLEQRSGVWRVAGGDLAGLRVDYPEYAGAWPSRMILAALPEGSATLRLRISEHIINFTVDPATFSTTPPPGARLMTLADLRARFRQQ